ncbi:MAG: OsmC family protein [Oceanicaulis sp.]
MKRTGHAVWNGDLKTGKGALTTGSGVLKDTKYGFKTRFEDEPGTNPEELIGAAHAGCYSMALSMILGEQGLVADEIRTQADVHLDEVVGGFEITAVDLKVRARISDASDHDFQKAADAAKTGCPVSKLLKAQISLDAALD